MTNFAKISKLFFWVTSIFLALSLFLFPLYDVIDNNNMYAKGYEINDVYDKVPFVDVWKVTYDTQSFFKGKDELSYFSSAESEHLLEVKEVISFLKFFLVFCILGFAISLGLFSRFSFQNSFGKLEGKTKSENEKVIFDFKDLAKRKFFLDLFSKVFRSSSIILFTLLLFFGVLASSWDWFFRVFHEILFSGQWMFPSNTLMIKLWGGNFFVIAAKFVAVRIIVIAIILFGLSYALESVQKKKKKRK